MKKSGAGNANTVTLDQLVSLNDEIAALVRAGVPLERGIAELAHDLPGRSGKLAALLGRRMSAGESLSQIFASETQEFPPLWRAVVEAGLRSGQLAAALESMSTTTRRIAELRKMMGAALLYPLIVLAVAYGVFVFLATRLAPTTSRIYEDLTGASEPVLNAVAWLGQNAFWWAAWIPLGLAAVLGVQWYRSGQADWWQGRGNSSSRWRRRGWRGLMPGQSLRDGRMAAFAEVLSLLIQHQVPLEQAIALAGNACGDAALREASLEIAERLRRGETLARREDLPPQFPPMLAWLVGTGAQQPELSKTLSRIAANYRERAARSATWTAVYLPIVLTVLLGGTATLLIGLITFLPLFRLLYDLGRPF